MTESILVKSCGEFNKQVVVVRLIAFEGGFVADGCAAFVTAVNDDKSLFGIGQGLNGAENSLTVVGSVTGVYVNVKRAEAKRAVIARGVAKWLNLFATVFAYEA